MSMSRRIAYQMEYESEPDPQGEPTCQGTVS